MIGSALKKFAAENGLTVSDGLARGNYQGYAITLGTMIAGHEINLTYGEILPYIFYLLGESTEYYDATMANLIEGLLFALIDVGGMLYKTHKETKKFKMKDMSK